MADSNNTVASLFGIKFSLPEKLKEIYSNFGIDLNRFNGNNSWQLALSGRFIADKEGVIRSVEVHPDYTVRPEPSEISEILRSF